MITRRELIQRSAMAATALASPAIFSLPGLFAEEIQTAQMIEGPFYPDKMPLDTDNDLLILNDSLTPAVGRVTHLSGKILSKTGQPILNAFVEIWQTDARGSYIHGGDKEGKKDLDRNFQGYGRFLTNHKGEYYFRTIKPVPYTHMGLYRAPHIHFGISVGGKRIFTTQMMINGHKDNDGDRLLQSIDDLRAQKTLLVDFNPIKNSKINALSAEFNIVLGHTVEELDDGSIRGLGKSQGMKGFSGGRGRRRGGAGQRGR